MPFRRTLIVGMMALALLPTGCEKKQPPERPELGSVHLGGHVAGVRPGTARPTGGDRQGIPNGALGASFSLTRDAFLARSRSVRPDPTQ